MIFIRTKFQFGVCQGRGRGWGWIRWIDQLSVSSTSTSTCEPPQQCLRNPYRHWHAHSYSHWHTHWTSTDTPTDTPIDTPIHPLIYIIINVTFQPNPTLQLLPHPLTCQLPHPLTRPLPHPLTRPLVVGTPTDTPLLLYSIWNGTIWKAMGRH